MIVIIYLVWIRLRLKKLWSRLIMTVKMEDVNNYKLNETENSYSKMVRCINCGRGLILHIDKGVTLKYAMAKKIKCFGCDNELTYEDITL